MDTLQFAELGGELVAARTRSAEHPNIMRCGAGRELILIVLLCALAVCKVVCAQSIAPADPAVRADAPIDANRPYGQELNGSAAADLVIAAAGSLIIDSPAGALAAWDRVQLQRMACRFQHPNDPEHCEQLAAPPATVSLFGSRFESGTAPSADYTSDYDVNSVHVANELRSVREAKQNSDLVIVSIGVGPLDLAEPKITTPPTVLMRLAHAVVDAGADLVMATGPTSLGAIEIYQPLKRPARPILYGLGRLYRSAAAQSLARNCSWTRA